MRFDVQVLDMLAEIFVVCFPRLTIPLRVRVQGWQLHGTRVCGTVMLSAQLSALWYIPLCRQLVRGWSVGLTRLYNSGIGNRVRWGLYDVPMTRLYIHKTTRLIGRRCVRRHVEWIAKLSSLWYAQLCTTWGRHVNLLGLPVGT